jgi:hypothetical protein
MELFLFKITKIQCITATESEDDEVYFEVAVQYQGEEEPILAERVPANEAELIRLLSGRTTEEPYDVFSGPLKQPVRIEITMREQDFLGRMSRLGILDDFLGKIAVRIQPDHTIQWDGIESAIRLDSANNHIQSYEFVGSNALYQVTFTYTPMTA